MPTAMRRKANARALGSDAMGSLLGNWVVHSDSRGFVPISGEARADAIAQGFAVDIFPLEEGFRSLHDGTHLLH